MGIARNVGARRTKTYSDSKYIEVKVDCIPKNSRFYGARLVQGENTIEIPEELLSEAKSMVYDQMFYERAKAQHESSLMKWLADPKNEKKSEKDYPGTIGAVYKQMTAGQELGRFRSVQVVGSDKSKSSGSAKSQPKAEPSKPAASK